MSALPTPTAKQRERRRNEIEVYFSPPNSMPPVSLCPFGGLPFRRVALSEGCSFGGFSNAF
eukprot:scaffold935_cov248-Pinguiococcus_pyrenoidosus.AAC.14